MLRSISAGAFFALIVAFAPGASAAGAEPLRVAQSQDRAKQIAAADAEILSARNQLEQARRAFESGRKTSSADRVNQLEGGGPYTDAYYLRVEALKAEVTKAQQRLDRALTARKALGE